MGAVFQIKVLVLYYACSGDERVEDAVYKALKNLREHIRGCVIVNWASTRWFECLISIYWMYERRQEDWLIGLAVPLYAQGISYRNLFENWQDQEPRDEWSHLTHVVNLSMALKSEVLMSRITGKENGFLEKMIELLQKYHGTAAGHFTGDECLSGNSPVQGTELYGVDEAMHSYEVLFSITGNEKWLDRLETLAFNAFPATVGPDMWTHQYDQVTNQIACTRFKGKAIFRTNGADTNLFGLEPNFGCCTVNFNQAWPKFVLSTFYKCDNGIVSASLAPSVVKTKIADVAVTVRLITEYPFKNKLTYVIEPEENVEFDLYVRIPACVNCAVMGSEKIQGGGLLKISRLWSGTQTVEIKLDFKTEFINRYEELVYLKRGPLLYSVSIDEEWTMHEYEKDGVERRFPYCDYEVHPKSKWNYAFYNTELEVEEYNLSDIPFSPAEPPVKIYANMVEIDWGDRGRV